METDPVINVVLVRVAPVHVLLVDVVPVDAGAVHEKVPFEENSRRGVSPRAVYRVPSTC